MYRKASSELQVRIGANSRVVSITCTKLSTILQRFVSRSYLPSKVSNLIFPKSPNHHHRKGWPIQIGTTNIQGIAIQRPKLKNFAERF